MSLRKFLVAALAVALAALVSPRVQASDLTGPYLLSWKFERTELSPDPFWVEEQGEILRTRLLPHKLYVPLSDIFDLDGRLQISAGTEMVSVSAPVEMACNVTPSAEGRGKSKRICVLDSDSDGLFDTAFSKRKDGRYWMTLKDELEDERLYPIEQVEMESREPASIQDAPLIVFHYQRILDGGLTWPLDQEGGDQVRFHFRVGRERKLTGMFRNCADSAPPSHCATANFPSTYEVAGLRLRLLARRGEDLQIQFSEPFGEVAVHFIETFDGYSSGEMHYAN